MSDINMRVPTIAAVDLDDTLLRPDGTLSPVTLATLQRWVDSGRRVVIATGRPPRSVTEMVPPVLQDVPWVCYNGAIALEQQQIIFHDFLAPTVGRTIVEHVQRQLPDCAIGLEIDGLLHLNRHHGRPKQFVVGDLTPHLDSAAAKILFFHDDYSAVCAVLSSIPIGARVILSEKFRFGQVMSATADKVHALDFVVQRWGMTLQDVIAFGDDVNDVGMIEFSGVGVAMDNAVDAVKVVAKRITRTNDEDGVARVLAEILGA